ncbi:hypothetical protein QO219_16445, partial [Vibrio vulnificus]|uniref:hypothetical protein n=1 Tax=Vibrio vulnificus TaxID=672 RepID=UPI0024DFCE97
TRHLACADKWFPVCTGMTAGGGGVQSFCSLALIFDRLFLSFFNLVILANAGTHGAASVEGRYYYCIVVVLAVCCEECISKRGIWRVRINGFPCARE